MPRNKITRFKVWVAETKFAGKKAWVEHGDRTANQEHAQQAVDNCIRCGYPGRLVGVLITEEKEVVS